jgi:hypothetical protein
MIAVVGVGAVRISNDERIFLKVFIQRNCWLCPVSEGEGQAGNVFVAISNLDVKMQCLILFACVAATPLWIRK